MFFMEFIYKVIALFEVWSVSLSPYLAGGEVVKDTLFRSTVFQDPSGYVASFQMDSEVRCAVACNADVKCESFAYNSTAKMCDINSQKPGPVYRKSGKCPTGKGYTLHLHSGIRFCLKYFATKLTQTEAGAICNGDNGHLALVDNGSLRDYIGVYLHAEGVGSSERVYFDGVDIMDDETFVAWNGDDISPISWTGGNKNNDLQRNCLAGNADDGYVNRPIECDSNRAFLCKIDIF